MERKDGEKECMKDEASEGCGVLVLNNCVIVVYCRLFETSI